MKHFVSIVLLLISFVSVSEAQVAQAVRRATVAAGVSSLSKTPEQIRQIQRQAQIQVEQMLHNPTMGISTSPIGHHPAALSDSSLLHFAEIQSLQLNLPSFSATEFIRQSHYRDSLMREMLQFDPKKALRYYAYMSIDSLLKARRLEQADIYMWDVSNGIFPTLSQHICSLSLMKDTVNADSIKYVPLMINDPMSDFRRSFATGSAFNCSTERFQGKEFTLDVERDVIRVMAFSNLEEDPFLRYQKIEPTEYPFRLEQYFISVFTMGESNYSVSVKLQSSIENEEQLAEMEEQLLQIGTQNTLRLHDMLK